MNEKIIRLIIIIFTALLHVIVLFFVVFHTQEIKKVIPENARIMILIDLEELPPPMIELPDYEPEIVYVEEIAEVIIETETTPEQIVVPAATILIDITDDFLPAHLVTTIPRFDDEIIATEIVYPPIALRSGIEGRVLLDLFVGHTGLVEKITILREEPEGRGFGEAAERVFLGRQGIPATVNGEPVPCRFRYPVVFRIN
ncbi:MAG: TonB family protein [Treponema sp.]|jgi:protein TonB|nr:TonB family protein [Treponema sp.]